MAPSVPNDTASVHRLQSCCFPFGHDWPFKHYPGRRGCSSDPFLPRRFARRRRFKSDHQHRREPIIYRGPASSVTVTATDADPDPELHGWRALVAVHTDDHQLVSSEPEPNIGIRIGILQRTYCAVLPTSTARTVCGPVSDAVLFGVVVGFSVFEYVRAAEQQPIESRPRGPRLRCKYWGSGWGTTPIRRGDVRRHLRSFEEGVIYRTLAITQDGILPGYRPMCSTRGCRLPPHT